jgi:putative transposase
MDEKRFHSSAHAVHDLHVHLVFTPKYRRRVMTVRVTELLMEVFEEVCGNMGCVLTAAETDGDHAHLLIRYPPKVSVSQLVRVLKTNSAARVREQHWPEVERALRGNHFWSPSYSASSAGGAPLEVVKAYVQNQQAPGRIRRKHP